MSSSPIRLHQTPKRKGLAASPKSVFSCIPRSELPMASPKPRPEMTEQPPARKSRIQAPLHANCNLLHPCIRVRKSDANPVKCSNTSAVQKRRPTVGKPKEGPRRAAAPTLRCRTLPLRMQRADAYVPRGGEAALATAPAPLYRLGWCTSELNSPTNLGFPELALSPLMTAIRRIYQDASVNQQLLPYLNLRAPGQMHSCTQSY